MYALYGERGIDASDRAARCSVTSAELLARFPDLVDHKSGALARYYDVKAVAASPTARAVFILPGGLAS
jgi:hypothetical protein